MTIQSLKNLAYMVSVEKANVKVLLLLLLFSIEKICQLSPLNMCGKKSGIFMIYLT